MTVVESVESVPTNTFHRQPEQPWLLHVVGRCGLRLFGWKIQGELPPIPKMVVAAAPHTSNLDGLLMVFGIWQLRIRIIYMSKKELVRGPLGWCIHRLGGIPIDRGVSSNTVDQVATEMQRRETAILVIAPEGTRRKGSYWKTGFYWIAYNARAPILCVGVDYRRKVIDLTGPLVLPTGNIEADMATTWGFFRTMTAKHPENVSEMRLRPTDVSAAPPQ